MKFDVEAIRADTENFMVHEHELNGETVLLIQPTHIGCSWTKGNLTQRSIVVTKDGQPVSLSFKKFANYGEKPEVFRVPTTLNGCEAMEKIDGSTLCVSDFHGEVIRTRGTVDARKQDNGAEIEVLKEKYPKAFDNDLVKSGDFTAVFEWYSPSNKIVINYGDEPLLYLTAIISHGTYRYTSQDALDFIAKQWDVLRPRRYTFNTMNELRVAVEAFRGVEGVCLYFGDGQEITKLKGAEYLFLHRAKSDVSSIEKVMDLYLDQWKLSGEFPSYSEFFTYLEKSFDHEIASMARGHVSKICDAMKQVNEILHGMRNFLTPIMVVNPPRKIVAEKIFQAYGQTGRAGMLFHIYDRKPMGADDYKKLLFQCLKD